MWPTRNRVDRNTSGAKRLRKAAGLALVFSAGVLVAVGSVEVRDRARRLVPFGTVGEALEILVREVGTVHFFSCEDKVQALHAVINAKPVSNQRLARRMIHPRQLLVSILWARRSCAVKLLDHIDSTSPVEFWEHYPRTSLYFAQGLDEGELALFVLARVFPEKAPPAFWIADPDQFREVLSAWWTQQVFPAERRAHQWVEPTGEPAPGSNGLPPSVADGAFDPPRPAAVADVEERWVEPFSGIAFRWVPPGQFTMGSPWDEPGRDADEAPHQVTISRPLWVGETAVTESQWLAVMDRFPGEFYLPKGDDYPILIDRFEEAVVFANELSQHLGLPPCYEILEGPDHVIWRDFECEGFRLPTEAEWEWAARGGQAYAFAGSDNVDSVAWYWENALEPDTVGPRTLMPVARRQANGWGLFDMSGNVWERVWDWFGEYPTEATTDPTGPESGEYRVIRGGGFMFAERQCRVAYRAVPHRRPVRDVGFRLVRTAP